MSQLGGIALFVFVFSVAFSCLDFLATPVALCCGFLFGFVSFVCVSGCLDALTRQRQHPLVLPLTTCLCQSVFFNVRPDDLQNNIYLTDIYLQTPYCPLGDLHDYVRRRRRELPIAFTAGLPHIARGVLLGLQFLHAKSMGSVQGRKEREESKGETEEKRGGLDRRDSRDDDSI